MCAFLACGSIPLLSAKIKIQIMKPLVIRIVLETGDTYVFNFSHVTMFTFNKDKRTASVNLLDDKYKVFKDVVELQLEKVYG